MFLPFFSHFRNKDSMADEDKYYASLIVSRISRDIPNVETRLSPTVGPTFARGRLKGHVVVSWEGAE